MLLFDSTNTASAANFALYDYHIPSDAATGHDLWNDSETINIIEGTYAYMESNWWSGSFFSPIFAKNFEIQAGYHYFFERWTWGASYLLISWLTCCENPDNEPIRSEELSILPTCTEKGLDVFVCKFCGEVCYDEEVPALGHDYIVKEVVPPTCLDDGYTTYICTRCGDEYDDDPVPALGHDYAVVVTPPTCLEQGFTTYTCNRCGYEYVDNYVPALGHDYVAVVTPPTCLDQGFTTYTCSRCGDTYVADYVPALGHDYKYSFGVENNVPYAKCLRCGHKLFVVKIDLDAYVDKISGNKNDLTITVTETYQDGHVAKLTKTFVIDNNAIGTYTIEYYKIYVDTKGNVQIRELYIANGIKSM